MADQDRCEGHAPAGGRRAAVRLAVTGLARLCVQDLNVTGMLQLGTLARALADPGLADLGSKLGCESAW